MSKVVGIDFGTTNTLVAFMTPSGPKTIPDHNGDNLTPSIVAKYQGSLYVGREAKDSPTIFVHGNGIKEIKRKIGSGETISFAGKIMKPHEVAALILTKAKRNAELFLNDVVDRAVITVPAEFSDLQRREIIEAGKIAGLQVEKIINEPTAALMAYVFKTHMTNKTILCYDFGGGTFDVSVARVTSSGVEVKCVGGDRSLGGKELDQILLQHIQADIERTKMCRLNDTGVYQLLLETEKVKRELSSRESASFNLKKLETKDGRKVDYFKRINRSEFERLIVAPIEKTLSIVGRVLSENHINPRMQIDEILLIGGSSRIPLVKHRIKQMFGKEPVYGDLQSDESVALGAAIEAGHTFGATKRIGPVIIADVSPYAIGLKVTEHGVPDIFDPIIKKNFPYDKEYSEKYSTIFDNQKSMLLEIYQGESTKASENELIGQFNVEDIPMRKAGEEEVRVSFIFDSNGVLQIKATILSSGKDAAKQIRYHKEFTTQQTQSSRQNVQSHFITKEKFENAVALRNSLKKHSMDDEVKQLEQAMKNENQPDLEKITSSLLD